MLKIIDGQEIQDTGQLNKAFLSALPMTANIAEQTRFGGMVMSYQNSVSYEGKIVF